MLRSMTGFAAATLTVATDDSKTTLSINLKSLNSRFFEATCKLPYQLSHVEIDFTSKLKENLFRGHIYLTVYANNEDLFRGSVEPSFHTFEGYVNAIDLIKKKYSVSGELTVSDLLRIPDLFSIEISSISDKTKQTLYSTLERLIKELIVAQEKEGAELKKDIENRIVVMQQEIDAIEKNSSTLIERKKEKVIKTLQEVHMHENSLADVQKHAAYVLLEKMDINEEIVRFKSHLKNLSTMLISPDIEKGKRLDFTLQEMAREVNTIAAKCSDATISAFAINIKVELEKAREQVQNIV